MCMAFTRETKADMSIYPYHNQIENLSFSVSSLVVRPYIGTAICTTQAQKQFARFGTSSIEIRWKPRANRPIQMKLDEPPVRVQIGCIVCLVRRFSELAKSIRQHIVAETRRICRRRVGRRRHIRRIEAEIVECSARVRCVGPICLGRQQPSRFHKLVHNEKDQNAYDDQHDGRHHFGKGVQHGFLCVQRSSGAGLAVTAILGGQATGQGRERQRLRKRQFVQ